jgi:hypothetical protein
MTVGAVMNEGAMSVKLGLKGWPNAAEDLIVARNCILSEYTGAHIHMQHVSSRNAIEVLRRAKSRGVRVTAEACPHHLALTDDAGRQDAARQLLDLLRDRGFTPFIVSGGGADFMRVWVEEVYGIPPHHVVGSYGKVRHEVRGDAPVLVKAGGIELVDDREGKPVGIHRFIGRRPVAAFGNSDGDQAMLEWTTIGRSPSFGLLVHHTDAEREWAYDAAPASTGKLVTALEAAPARGWVVVDMARDWKVVFRPEGLR